MNGANCSKNTPYEPQVSSYDYDAPVDEAGNVTNKFKVFRSVIEKISAQRRGIAAGAGTEAINGNNGYRFYGGNFREQYSA